MRCLHCGYENNENAAYCQNCGQRMAQEQSQNPQYEGPQDTFIPHRRVAAANPAAERVLSMLKDNIFFAICILVSISCGISLLSLSLPVFQILYTVFLWLIFAESRKGKADQKYMRYVSGTVYASYVTNLVVFCIFAVCGLICLVLFAAFSGSGLLDRILADLEVYTGGYARIFNMVASASFMLIAVALIFAAVFGSLITFFGMHTVHRFAQSLYRSVGRGELVLVKRGTAQTWFTVFGVFSAISAVGSLFLAGAGAADFLAGGCQAAAWILAGILIGKHFADCR